MSLIVLWTVFFALSFGAVLFNFASMRRVAHKPWPTKIEKSYRPKVTILVPTYNESSVIRLKLENLTKLKYPKNLMQIIVVDSNSIDQTLGIVNDFVKNHREIKIDVLIEKERSGKSGALNLALKQCSGDVIIVSDADCFWPSDILEKALPYLADSEVVAISGPKILLNPKQSWVTKTEDSYLNSVNLVKLGESKIGSTLLFEGGFSAYKKGVVKAFDPYNTGSDDCGTVIKILEDNFRAVFVPEAMFFTTFPASLRGKVSMKMRRANQLVRVFGKYAALLFRNRLRRSKRIVLQNIFVSLFSPVMFVLLIMTTVLLALSFPYFVAVFLVVLVPKARFYLFEVTQGFLVLFLSLFSVALGKKKTIWNTTEDRRLVSEDLLRQHMLI